MNTRRSEIHLGDLAQALKKLKWRDEAQANAIAAHLGFGMRPVRQATEPASQPWEIYDRQPYRQKQTATTPQRPAPVYTPPPPVPQPALPRTILPSSLAALEQQAQVAPTTPDWLNQPDGDYDPTPQPAMARQPIFPDAVSRALLATALATDRPGAEVDVRKLIARICRREVVRDLPCLNEASLDHGCQLLLDYSASMVPWWEDLASLRTQVTRVVGQAHTQVYSFDRDPVTAARWTTDLSREPWRPDGRPVLVATDLGIQGRSGRGLLPADWNEVMARCALQGSPLILLVPWPESRWPKDFGVAATLPILVHWSPHTTAAMIGHRKGD